MMSRFPEVKYVSAATIRRMFNESQIPSMIKNRVLTSQFLHNVHLKQPERVNEPKCTHSQVIRYLDERGRWVAEVHQYKRKDGTIGGSGQADPKRLRAEGAIFISESEE
jgi:hypothetical protein